MDNLNAVRAFRRYARYGFDRRELSAFDMYELIRGSVGSLESANEMLAVYDTMRLLAATGKSEACAAVRTVYFSYPHVKLKRNDIGLRVRYFAYRKNLDDRTVYRLLSDAKKLFLTLAKK